MGVFVSLEDILGIERKSIQTFLKQMAGGGARPAPAVLKELLQTADGADATEPSIILDERNDSQGQVNNTNLFTRLNKSNWLASSAGAAESNSRGSGRN